MPDPSIRRTLLIRCGIGIGLLFAVLSLSIYLMVRQSLYDELDESIRETASILANQVEYEHREIIFEWQEGIGTNPEIPDHSLFQYWDENAGTTTRSPALGDHDLPRFTGPTGTADIETISVPGRIDHARAIGLIVYPYVIPEEKAAMKLRGEKFDPRSRPHTLVVARDLTPVLRTLTYLAVILTIGTFVTFILGFLVIDRAVRASLSPIGKLTAQVRNRSENQLDSSIILPGGIPAELTPLAESFDQLLARVAAIRSRERDFIRHASHELRTPIASLSATTELALSRPRENPEYIRHLESCAKTTAELSGLVKRLSALARIGQATNAQAIVPTDTAEILANCLPNFSARLESAGILTEITTHPGLPPALADPVLLALIFNNLLDNAAIYSTPGSTLSIASVAIGKRIEISFTNPAEDLPENPDRLFEPLFRKDESRSETSDSHLGIGLTLSQTAAQAMQGALTVDRPNAELIRFTLSLPRA
jgi:signal transduction histidine kinase